MGRRLRPIAANAALVLVSLTLAYVALELVFFRAVAPHLSLNIRPLLPDTADVLAQNSKSGTLPRGYIALLGDSYAEGLGDWLLAADGDRAKPFHSANVIHRITGRDVVSFGRSGAGSAEAMVLRPARVFAGRDCYVFPGFEDPKQIAVYFYEGNDLTDNIRLLAGIGQDGRHPDLDAIDAFLRKDYGTVPPWTCHAHLAAAAYQMAHFLLYGRNPIRASAPTGNSFVIDGTAVGAPRMLQGPSLELGEDEMRAGALVFDRSLRWLRQRFPNTPVTVFYVPSPLAIYRHAGPVSVRAHTGAEMTFPSRFVDERSDLSCVLVRQSALDNGVGFADARPVLRAAASRRFIHGPIDWKHLNEAGYRVLGRFVASRLGDPAAAAPCASRTADVHEPMVN